ncbi:histidine phosphatase family protein [Hymenobacter busanensis]|uniref:Histidine phosphatase family protein n=1 Tax=Hymenobacter busanensis TaxID=2607656 RepID=A0A7L4ZUN3_9BACT|nr:histidine phosphatase family protein [Hymenobacter busanensis]KAA9339720.1 histidine phosphatase family protein [Hymenobacter busanensis]QHJ06526.1 histidine phosphatase family protein [Hymenobacter busanensis]
MFLLFRGLLLLLTLWLSGCSSTKPAGSAASTIVYLVRHGEKDTALDPKDPPLTAAGAQRALALRDSLQRRPVTAIFSTDTKRTRATVQPLAEAKKLDVQTYDAKPVGLAALAKQIRTLPRGKAVVVVGHSNTVLETIEALGAPRPVPSIADSEFNYLFEVTIPSNDRPATARALRYGAAQ